MEIKECGDKIVKGEKSIFLMGPISRMSIEENWYDTAVSYLEKAGYDGVVYIPYSDFVRDNYDVNIWRYKALENSTVACFWVPRKNPDMLGLDVNIFFGKCLNSDKLIYGRPDYSYKNDDLDNLYYIYNEEKPFNELEKLMLATKEKVDKLYVMRKFDVIKYLCETNPLIFKKIGEKLSKEERKYIIDNLDIEKSCANCTEYCCGGLKKCSRWNNDEIVGRVKAIGTLK